MLLGFSLLAIIIALLSIIQLFKLQKEKKRGWKIRKVGNGKIEYSELIQENWRSIEFKIELYSKVVARHAIIIPLEWNQYPEWAQENRKSILERISKQFKEPQFTIFEK